MCGATFDANQEVEEKPRTQSGVSGSSGRVRQQTTSVEAGMPASIASSTVAMQGAVSTPASKIPFENRKAESQPSVDFDDPLRNYVEEVEIENHQDPINGNGQTHTAKPAAPSPATAPSVRAPAPTIPATEAKAQSEQKVVVESGRSKPGGLSFGRAEPKSAEQRSDIRSEQKTEPRRESLETARPTRQAPSAPVPQRQETHTPRPEASRIESKVEMKQPTPQARETQREVSRSPATQPHRPSFAKPASDGALVGWFVDFKDAKGHSVELREGQFFVTKSKLKENDFVIDHGSISTPHAMIRILSNGVEIQDLMSEKGVQVQRFDGSGYKNQDERVKLAHGDWIKLGEVEYQVVLIPQKGTRG